MNFLKRLFGGGSNAVVIHTSEMFDIAAAEYKEDFRLGATGTQLPTGAEELLELILKTRTWVKENDSWPSPSGKCPYYTPIRELGESINRAGGIRAMWRAAGFVVERTKNAPPSRTLLKDIWNGIGEFWVA
jgi:hypothetical protein